jgi:hypothetical protein
MKPPYNLFDSSPKGEPSDENHYSITNHQIQCQTKNSASYPAIDETTTL